MLIGYNRQWRNFFGLAGVVIAILVPVIVRYIWAKELSEAAEDVVEVVGDVDPEEQSSGSNDVAVIVHDDSRRNGNTKAADVEWARLRDESAIRLPEQDMPETQALRSNTASRAHADQRDSPTNSQGWPFRLFGGRKSEGKIRL